MAGFLLFSFPIFSNPKTICLTIPKSGTHLAKKCFILIKKHRPEAQIPLCTHFYTSHRLPEYMDPEVVPIAKRVNETTRIIFLTRDLRDALVSMMYHFESSLFFNHIELNTAKWEMDTSVGKVLMEYLTQSNPSDLKKDMFKENVAAFKTFYGFKNPHVVIKFEDLIGPKGGGDLEAQYKAIYRLAKAIDIELSVAEVQEIADELFGIEGVKPQRDDEHFHIGRRRLPMIGITTFRKGEIGAWKHQLCSEHLKEIKDRYQWFLEKFEYEKDALW